MLRFFLFSLLTFSTLSFSSPVFAQTKKMVVLGDSLTEGYGVARESAFPALLEKKIQADKKAWSVVNAGVSGSTTASAMGRMKWILRSKPDMILLCLGANDGLRGLKVEQSRKNLADAIAFARANKITLVLGGLYMPPNYGEKYTADFRKMYEGLASEYKVPFISFLLDGVGGQSKYNLADGIHPNEKGHAIIADNVYKAIKELL